MSVGVRVPSTATTTARRSSQAAVPAARPPPPHATSTVSTPPACSHSSATSVPAPAIVTGSSYGCRKVAPVRATWSRAPASASANTSPTRWTTAPYRRSRRTLASAATPGTNTSARCPNRAAPHATATAWLPPDAATTPSGPMARLRKWFATPLALKLPLCWTISSFRTSSRRGIPRSSPTTRSTGVRRTWGAMRAAARSTSSRSGTAAAWRGDGHGPTVGGTGRGTGHHGAWPDPSRTRSSSSRSVGRRAPTTWCRSCATSPRAVTCPPPDSTSVAAALPRAGRAVSHQRPEPGPGRSPGAPSSAAAASTCRSTSATATGTRCWPRPWPGWPATASGGPSGS